MPSKNTTLIPAQLPPMLELHAPGWTRWMVRLITWLLVVLPFGLYWVPWQQNINGSGQVVARDPLDREIRIDSPINDGVIEKVFVTEGSRVTKGQTLFVVSDLDPDLIERLRQQRADAVSRRDAAQSQFDAMTIRVGELEKSRELQTFAMDQSITGAREVLASAEQSILAAEQSRLAAQAARETARLQFERISGVVNTARRNGLPNPVSDRDYELATLSRDQTEAEVKRADASLASAVNTRNRAAAAVRGIEADRDRLIAENNASIESARSSQAGAAAAVKSANIEVINYDTRISRFSRREVVAPREGTIVRLLTTEGAILKTGTGLAVLLPDTDNRTVELTIDGNDVPLILRKMRDGDPPEVRLQFEGWPAIQFAGWPQVAVGTFRGRVAVVDAVSDGRGEFRILVVEDPHYTRTEAADAQWPDRDYLRQGVKVKGWVLLESVPLGYEIWRQFNGFPPMIPDKPKDGSDKNRKGGLKKFFSSQLAWYGLETWGRGHRGLR